MTTTELHQRFRVEYDKVNVISSYPSFLAEEIDVWLNKANNMIISLKLTGNNTRQVAFEGDTKRIADLLALIKSSVVQVTTNSQYIANAISFSTTSIPEYLFYITSTVKLDSKVASDVMLVSHEIAKRVTETAINKPWIPRPVAVIEAKEIVVYYDTIANPNVSKASLNVTYVKKPLVIDVYTAPTAVYELGDNVAYELLNSAVLMALENVESGRISSSANLLTLQE